jgi:tetratricopeptide (TPR) repeat protein
MRLLALAFLGLSAFGCGPRFALTRPLPARIDTADQKIFQLQTRAAGADSVADSMRKNSGSGEELDANAPVAALDQALRSKLLKNGFTDGDANLELLVEVTDWRTEKDVAPGTTAPILRGKLTVRLTSTPRSRAPTVLQFQSTPQAGLPDASQTAQVNASLRAQAVEAVSNDIVTSLLPEHDRRLVPLVDSGDVAHAAELMKAGSLEQARGELDKLLEANPKNAPALYLRGLLYETDGNHPEASALYLRAWEADHQDLYKDAANRVNGLRRVR